jgi:inward rectifier potassium channel
MFLSAQTLTTVGYGILSPGTALMSSIAAIESMAGLLIFGVFTGLAFGRFSRIRPRFIFSQHMLLTPYKDGLNALMVRFANERSGAIMDARASLILALEYHDEDRLRRQFYELSLEISHVRSLALSWTLVHPITTDSPLYRLDPNDFERVHAEAILVIHAYDDTVGQPFYSRKSWTTSDLLRGYRFKPMFTDTPDGVVEMDLSKIDDAVEAELFPFDEHASKQYTQRP